MNVADALEEFCLALIEMDTCFNGSAAQGFTQSPEVKSATARVKKTKRDLIAALEAQCERFSSDVTLKSSASAKSNSRKFR